jgi:hypothetical protein
MPARPTWLARVPHSLGSLQAETAPPFPDRPAVEILFGVRPRQVLHLPPASPARAIARHDSRLPPRLEAVAPASPEPVAAPHLARALRADEGEVQLVIDGPTAD